MELKRAKEMLSLYLKSQSQIGIFSDKSMKIVRDNFFQFEKFSETPELYKYNVHLMEDDSVMIVELIIEDNMIFPLVYRSDDGEIWTKTNYKRGE